MRDPITEILQLVVDRIVRPEDGRSLLRALRRGYPEAFEEPHAPTQEVSAQDVVAQAAHGGERDSIEPSNSPVAPSRGPAAGAGRPVHPPEPAPIATAPEFQSPYLIVDESVEVPSGTFLRIDAAGFDPATASPLSSAAIRGATGQKLRVVRGSGVELYRDEEAAWRLTWSGGMLFLEVPAKLAGLEILGIPGSVGLSGYTGPFSAEAIGGGFTVHGAAAPFRIRGVQGTVQLLRLSLRDGISTIAAVSQNVEIEPAPDASVTIRASLRTEGIEGGPDRDGEEDPDNDLGGRHGVWRVGAGTAQLNVSQVRGQLRLRPADQPGSGGP